MKMWRMGQSLILIVFCWHYIRVTGGVLVTLPSFEEILTGNLVGTYKLTRTCKAVLTGEGGCAIDLKGEPDGCVTLTTLVKKLMGNSRTAREITSALPSTVHFQHVLFDVCNENLELEVTDHQDYEIVPGIVSLKDLKAKVNFDVPTDALTFHISGTWMIGNVDFFVSILKTEDKITVTGNPLHTDTFNMADITAAISSKLLPGNLVTDTVTTIGLNGLNLKDLALVAVFSEQGYSVQFSFSVVSSVFNDPNLYFTMSSIKQGTSSEKGFTVAGSFSQVQISSLFKTLTSLDISGIPFISSMTGSISIMHSSIKLGNPLIPYTDQGLVKLTPVVNGTRFWMQVTLQNIVTQMKVTVTHPVVTFEIPSGILSVGSFITSMIPDTSSIILPPNFNLQSFFKADLRGFRYNPETKKFYVIVDLAGTVVLVPNIIQFMDSSIEFEVNTETKKVGFELESLWRLGNIEILFKINKPSDISVFIGEASPQTDIPFGNLLQQFAVAFLPSGKLENMVKKIGLGSFSISDPTVKIYFSSNTMVTKFSGTVNIGNWKNGHAEILVGKVSNSFLMATGISFAEVPITTLVKEITNGKFNLKSIPGSYILDGSGVALSMSAQKIPNLQNFMQYSMPMLSGIDIARGVTLFAPIRLPDTCPDPSCNALKKILGAKVRMDLKGVLDADSIHLSATVPNPIKIFNGNDITDAGIEIKMGLTTSFGIILNLVIPDPALTFTGRFGISSNGLYLSLSMNGWWYKPFDIPNVAIGNLHIGASILPDFVALSSIEFGGQGKFGLLNNPNAKLLKTSMFCGINRVQPLENYFLGSFSPLTITSLFDAFAIRTSVPEPFSHIGFPKGLNISYAGTEKILDNGIKIPEGYKLQGTIQTLFLKVSADINISPSRFFVDTSVDPFKIGNGLVEISGRSASVGPRLIVDIGLLPLSAFINIEGYYRILSITSFTNITVDQSGMSFKVGGPFLKLFQADLAVTISFKSIVNGDFQVDGVFKQDLYSDLEQKVSDELNDYKKAADKAIEKADAAIDKAQEKFVEASDKIANARKDVDYLKKKFDKANAALDNKEKDLKKKKKAWENKVAKVEDARKDVEKKQKALKQAADDVKAKKKKSCPSPCRKRRSTDEDVFMHEEEAKEFVQKRSPRVKRGWRRRRMRVRVRVKSPKEIAKEAAEKTRRTVEVPREKAEDLEEKTRCAAQMTKRELCKKALSAAEGAVKTASGSLDAVKKTLSAAEKAAKESKVVFDVAQAALNAAQGTVNAAKTSLDKAKEVLSAAAEALNKAQLVTSLF